MSKRQWILPGIFMLAALQLTHVHAAATPPAPDRESRGTGLWRVGPAQDADCDFQNIQDAVDATAVEDGGLSTINIRVSGSASVHEGNTYVIDAQDFENVTRIRVIGGHDSCSDTSPSTEPEDRTELDANQNGRVFELIYNASLSDPVVTMELENLRITGGLADSAGGGIRIRGHAGHQRVRLSNVGVRNNTTTSLGSGGGISLEADFTASGSVAWFSMTNESMLANNHAAGAGGGFACFNEAGSDNPPVLLFETLIIDNEAAFNGGGVALNGCRNVSILNNGTFSGGSVLSNVAGVGNDGAGGGIHASNGAQLILEASGDEYPAKVYGNEADRGGGIAAEGADTVAATRIEISSADIEENRARETGGGLYVADEAHLIMGRHGGTTGFPGSCKPPSDSLTRCSRLTSNDSQANAAAIAIRTDARAEIYQTIIGENTADVVGSSRGGVAHVSGTDSSLLIEGAWVHSNSGSPSLLSLRGDAEMHIHWSTIAGNALPDGGSRVFLLDTVPDQEALLNVIASIVWEPNSSLVDTLGSDFTAIGYCLIGHAFEDQSGFDPLDFYSNIDPHLINPASGNLSLGYHSPAIDYCDDAIAPQFGDIFNNSRGGSYNLDTIEPPSSVAGATFDIGAHERQPVQVEIFSDEFEG